MSVASRSGAGAVEAVGFSTAALTVATVSLFALPAFADELAAEMSLSSAEVGFLTSALALSYAAVQAPAQRRKREPVPR